MDGERPPKPDIGYVYCDSCLDGHCDQCIGLTHTRPFCGHRCGYLLRLRLVKDDDGDSR